MENVAPPGARIIGEMRRLANRWKIHYTIECTIQIINVTYGCQLMLVGSNRKWAVIKGWRCYILAITMIVMWPVWWTWSAWTFGPMSMATDLVLFCKRSWRPLWMLVCSLITPNTDYRSLSMPNTRSLWPIIYWRIILTIYNQRQLQKIWEEGPVLLIHSNHPPANHATAVEGPF